MKGTSRQMPKTTFSLSATKGKWIWIVTILVILTTAGWYYYSKSNLSSQVTNNSQWQTAIVRQGNLIVSATGSGTLITGTDATFGFKTSGQVTQVNVKVGDQVEAGQVLAQLDDTLAQMKYVEAEQNLREFYSAASIAAIQKEVATAKDTEVSARAWLGYLISPEVLDAEENLAAAQQRLAEAQSEAQKNPSDSANQKVKSNEAAVAYLQDRLKQAQTYYNDVYLPQNFGEFENVGTRRHPKVVPVTYVDPYTGAVLPKIDGPSPADIAKARSDYAQAKQTIQDGKTYLDILKTGVIPENATGDRINSLMDAQQAVRDAQSALDDTKLIAPISGTVTSLDLSVGEQAGTSPVITISQLGQPYQVDAHLDEADWSMAQIGNSVNITFDLLPDQTFTGTITTVYPELTSSFNSSLVHIVVTLDKSIHQNLPGGTGASLEVIGGEANNAVLAPINAIHKVNGKYTVSVIQNGQEMKQEVEVGLQNATYAEIKSGLRTGEIVVTN